MKLFLISGRARNGKGTISAIMKEEYEKMGRKVCFIQLMRTLKGYLKDYFDWDGSEETKPREMLQQIGTELIRKELDQPFFHIDRLTEDLHVLEKFFDVFIVDDVRLPLEIETLKERFPGAVSINVRRENYTSDLSDHQQAHFTEHALDHYRAFDYDLVNTSIEDLKEKVRQVIKSEVEKDEKNDQYRD